MGLLIALVVVVLVGGVLLYAVGGVAAIWLFTHGEKTRAKAEARAPEILDVAFDGRDDVVFKVNLESPSFETVVLGAKKRGYALTSQTADTDDGVAKTLIFERLGDGGA